MKTVKTKVSTVPVSKLTFEEIKTVVHHMRSKSKEEKIRALYKLGCTIKDITYALYFGQVYTATYDLRHPAKKEKPKTRKKRFTKGNLLRELYLR